MATKKKPATGNVVDINEVKNDIALTEEEVKMNDEVKSDVQSEADTSTANDQKVHPENSKVESNLSKKDKAKSFLKKNWKKIAIGAGCAAVVVGGYVIYKKTGIKTGKAARLILHKNPTNLLNGILEYADDGEVNSNFCDMTTITKSALPDWMNLEHEIEYIL